MAKAVAKAAPAWMLGLRKALNEAAVGSRWQGPAGREQGGLLTGC